ncbi:MAG: hypothetical protein RR907_06650 [Comamonas sp.]
MHTSLATVKRLNHAAQKRLDSVDAAQPDPFAAAAPVVLPEPDFWVRPSIAAYELPWQVCNGSASAEQAYLAGTVRALLATATGLPAQAVPDEYRYKWHGEKRFASTLDFIPKDGVDIEPLFTHAAPQAQADARDAESDYQRGYRHGYNRRDAEVQGALL